MTCLLGLEGIDVRLHQHVGQNQVLEARNFLRAAAFIVVLERL